MRKLRERGEEPRYALGRSQSRDYQLQDERAIFKHNAALRQQLATLEHELTLDVRTSHVVQLKHDIVDVDRRIEELRRDTSALKKMEHSQSKALNQVSARSRPPQKVDYLRDSEARVMLDIKNLKEALKVEEKKHAIALQRLMRVREVSKLADPNTLQAKLRSQKNEIAILEKKLALQA